MALTEEGKRWVKKEGDRGQVLVRRRLAYYLLRSQQPQDIKLYETGVCFQAVAFVRLLMGDDKFIGLMTGKETNAPDNYYNKFREGAHIWTGGYIKPGQAILFYRTNDNKYFHVAIRTYEDCVSGPNNQIISIGIRSVNSLYYGAGWGGNEQDAPKLLPANLNRMNNIYTDPRDPDAKIMVYVC